MCEIGTYTFAMRLVHLFAFIMSIYKQFVQVRYSRLISLGCARFADFLQNFRERQILWRMCSVVFHTFTLKIPIQTLLSVTPTCSVFWRTTHFQENEHTAAFCEKVLRGKTRGPARRRRISAPQKSSCCCAGSNIVNIVQWLI